ncbi:Uncharacterised protein [Vibrio cholerae]|nr:Uncharacterised protein [Vibrio cholerae]
MHHQGKLDHLLHAPFHTLHALAVHTRHALKGR